MNEFDKLVTVFSVPDDYDDDIIALFKHWNEGPRY